MKNYTMTKAEKMFYDEGYFRYESPNLECIRYESGVKQVVFLLYNKSVYAQIVTGDTNFVKYRPMEIECNLIACILQQVKELGWIDEQMEK